MYFDHTSYKIRRVGQRRFHTATSPVPGTIGAIFKFDSVDYPDVVYNEFVALRLAHLVRTPVADGCLVRTSGGNAFASLELADVGIPMPIVNKRDAAFVAWRYPTMCAALIAFDIWIGNVDRLENIKATIAVPAVFVFRGFDHASSLFSCSSSRTRSIKALNGKELVVENHPLFGTVKYGLVEAAAKRIAALPEQFIHEACRFGEPFGRISTAMQERLSRALVQRSRLLTWIVGEHQQRICTK